MELLVPEGTCYCHRQEKGSAFPGMLQGELALAGNGGIKSVNLSRSFLLF